MTDFWSGDFGVGDKNHHSIVEEIYDKKDINHLVELEITNLYNYLQFLLN